MESSFIPNLNPAIGRTSTPSLARSRRQNSTSGGFFGAFGLTTALESWTVRLFNAQRSTLNAQRSIQTVECWALDVGRWTFALFWRVKGAWWPSRSSKPLLITRMRDQGRFDSYPLRFFYARGMGFQPMFHRQDADATSRREVNACRASKFGGSRRYHPALAERQS
jgi:hypothetical protein